MTNSAYPDQLKSTELDLLCLPRQSISGFSKVKSFPFIREIIAFYYPSTKSFEQNVKKWFNVCHYLSFVLCVSKELKDIVPHTLLRIFEYNVNKNLKSCSWKQRRDGIFLNAVTQKQKTKKKKKKKKYIILCVVTLLNVSDPIVS